MTSFCFPAAPKVLSNFLEGSAEPLGRDKRAEAQHRVVSLFHSAVVPFDEAPTLLEDMATRRRQELQAVIAF